MKRIRLYDRKGKFLYRDKSEEVRRRANQVELLPEDSLFRAAQTVAVMRRKLTVEADGNVISLVAVQENQPEPKPEVAHVDVANVLLRSGVINEWEREFLESLSKCKKLTEKQHDKLVAIGEKVAQQRSS